MFNGNPFMWTPASSKLNTHVVRFDLRSANGTILAFSDLADPINLFIPLDDRVQRSNLMMSYVQVSSNATTLVALTTGGSSGGVKIRLLSNDSVPGNDIIICVTMIAGRIVLTASRVIFLASRVILLAFRVALFLSG